MLPWRENTPAPGVPGSGSPREVGALHGWGANRRPARSRRSRATPVACGVGWTQASAASSGSGLVSLRAARAPRLRDSPPSATVTLCKTRRSYASRPPSPAFGLRPPLPLLGPSPVRSAPRGRPSRLRLASAPARPPTPRQARSLVFRLGGEGFLGAESTRCIPSLRSGTEVSVSTVAFDSVPCFQGSSWPVVIGGEGWGSVGAASAAPPAALGGWRAVGKEACTGGRLRFVPALE